MVRKGGAGAEFGCLDAWFMLFSGWGFPGGGDDAAGGATDVDFRRRGDGWGCFFVHYLIVLASIL